MAIPKRRRNYPALSITPSLPVRDAYVSTKSHPTEGQSGPGFAWAPGTTIRFAPRPRIATQCRRIKRVAPLAGAAG